MTEDGFTKEAVKLINIASEAYDISERARTKRTPRINGKEELQLIEAAHYGLVAWWLLCVVLSEGSGGLNIEKGTNSGANTGDK